MWECWLNVRAPGKKGQKGGLLNVGALGVEEQDFREERWTGKRLSQMCGVGEGGCQVHRF